MGTKESSAKRDLAGFLVGGGSAAVSSGLVFRLFYPPLPPDSQVPDYTGMVMFMLMVGLFFCGGLVGRRGISVDFWSDLLPSVLGSYVFAGFCCIMMGLDASEALGILGFTTVGIFVSIVTTVTLSRWVPQKVQEHEV